MTWKVAFSCIVFFWGQADPVLSRSSDQSHRITLQASTWEASGEPLGQLPRPGAKVPSADLGPGIGDLYFVQLGGVAALTRQGHRLMKLTEFRSHTAWGSLDAEMLVVKTSLGQGYEAVLIDYGFVKDYDAEPREGNLARLCLFRDEKLLHRCLTVDLNEPQATARERNPADWVQSDKMSDGPWRGCYSFEDVDGDGVLDFTFRRSRGARGGEELWEARFLPDDGEFGTLRRSGSEKSGTGQDTTCHSRLRSDHPQ